MAGSFIGATAEKLKEYGVAYVTSRPEVGKLKLVCYIKFISFCCDIVHATDRGEADGFEEILERTLFQSSLSFDPSKYVAIFSFIRLT